MNIQRGTNQYQATGTGSVPRLVSDRALERLSIEDFSGKGDDSTINDTPISDAVTAALAQNKPLVFPGGTYRHNSVLSFGFPGLHLIMDGPVIFKLMSAQTQSIKIDSGAAGTYQEGIRIEGDSWVINGNNNAQDGLWIRNTIRNTIHCPRVINCTRYAFFIEGDVLSEYHHPTCSLNIDTTMSPIPTRGIYIQNTAAFSQTTALTIIGVRIEGVAGEGLYLDNCANINFIGGTSEGNSGANGKGVHLTANTFDCSFRQVFFEVNSQGDIFDNGKRNYFNGGAAASRAGSVPFDAVKSINVGATAEQAKFEGFFAYAGVVASGAIDTTFERMDFDDNVDDSGTRTQFIQTRQTFITADPFTEWQPGNRASSNVLVLDWYQEGTFTPAWGGSTGAGTIGYTSQIGRYTRVGNRVLFDIVIVVSSITVAPTGNLRITGLPFTVGANCVSTIAVGAFGAINLTADYEVLGFVPAQGATYADLFQSGEDQVLAGVPATALGVGTVRISGHYEV